MGVVEAKRRRGDGEGIVRGVGGEGIGGRAIG